MIPDCAPVVDWAGDFGHRLWLDQGCPVVEVVVDTWPLASAVNPGPIPGGPAYDVYARIHQGPNRQEVISLLSGAWTPIPAGTLTADGCAGQVDLSYLDQGRPEYAAGTVLDRTPTYRGLVPGGAWVVALPCTPPVLPPATTQPPTRVTRPPKTPEAVCFNGCDPPTTTTTVAPPAAPPVSIVRPPPTLPETGVSGAVRVLAFVGMWASVAGLWLVAIANLIRFRRRKSCSARIVWHGDDDLRVGLLISDADGGGGSVDFGTHARNTWWAWRAEASNGHLMGGLRVSASKHGVDMQALNTRGGQGAVWNLPADRETIDFLCELLRATAETSRGER